MWWGFILFYFILFYLIWFNLILFYLCILSSSQSISCSYYEGEGILSTDGCQTVDVTDEWVDCSYVFHFYFYLFPFNFFIIHPNYLLSLPLPFYYCQVWSLLELWAFIFKLWWRRVDNMENPYSGSSLFNLGNFIGFWSIDTGKKMIIFSNLWKDKILTKKKFFLNHRDQQNFGGGQGSKQGLRGDRECSGRPQRSMESKIL